MNLLSFRHLDCKVPGKDSKNSADSLWNTGFVLTIGVLFGKIDGPAI